MTHATHPGAGAGLAGHVAHRVDVVVSPALHDRDRLTSAFRPILAVPHLLLVGVPPALAISLQWSAPGWPRLEWGAATGALGALAAVCAFIAWFAILFGAGYPSGLRALVVYYLRWRVRAAAYLTLLRDDYPPLGEGAYPAELTIELPPDGAARNRWSVALRVFLVVPHAIAVWLLGVVWLITTIAAWCAILFTGEYPVSLYDFGVGVLRWSTRVEAYLLLLHDDYPPFSLH